LSTNKRSRMSWCDGAVRERHLSVGGYLDVGAPVAT
jgi:hypothetical protein